MLLVWGWIVGSCLSAAAAEAIPENPNAPLELTVDRAVEMALARNVDVATAVTNLQRFRSQYRQAVAALIGDLQGFGAYQRNIKKQVGFLTMTDPATGVTASEKIALAGDNSYSAGLHFEQPLFSGGRLWAGMSAGKKIMQLGQQSLRGAREEAVFATRQLFYDYLLASATATIQGDNLTLANDHLATIRERFRQGLDSDLIVLRQEVEAADAKTSLIQAKNLEDLAVTNLQNVLSLDVDKPLKLIGQLDPPQPDLPSYEVAVRRALDNNAALAVVRKQIGLYEEAVTVASADLWPDLKGFAKYDWAAESDSFAPGPKERNSSFAVGAKLEYKLFTGGDVRERIRQAKLDVEKARLEEQKITQGVRVQLKQQWLSLQEAQQRAQAQEKAVGQARRALEATEIRYRQGQASQLELNDATLALNRARTVYAQASHDYWVARFALEKVIGGSLKETL